MAGLTGEELAVHLGCAASRIRQLETCRQMPRRPEMVMLAGLANAPERLPALLQLWDDAHERGWWEIGDYRLPKWMKAYVGLETDACKVRCFALELVPGLVQTRAYTQMILNRPGPSPDDIEREVAIRQERQRGLERGQVWDVVVDEALLARTTHMGPVGAEQLDYLAGFAKDDRVSVSVLPFTAGGHRSMSGSFTLLDFSEGDPVAYQSYAVGGHLVDDLPVVEKLHQVYEELCAQSLDRWASAERIKQYALEGCGG